MTHIRLSAVTCALILSALVGCSQTDEPSGSGVARTSHLQESQAAQDAAALTVAAGDHQLGQLDSSTPDSLQLRMEGVESNRYVVYALCDSGGELGISVACTGDLGNQPFTIACDTVAHRSTVIFDPATAQPDTLTVRPPATGQWTVVLAWQESDDFPEQIGHE